MVKKVISKDITKVTKKSLKKLDENDKRKMLT